MNGKWTLRDLAIAVVVAAAIAIISCTATVVGVGYGVPVSSGWSGSYAGPYVGMW